MSKSVRLRRGTTLDHLQFAGAEGEITVDTTIDTVRLHDGVQLGGWPLLNSAKNSVITSPELIANRILYRNSYASVSAFPSAVEYPGMLAYSQADSRAYVSTGTQWQSFTQPADLTGFVVSSTSAQGQGQSILPPQNKIGTNLVFKTIAGGSNVTVASDNNTVTVSSASYTGANVFDNVSGAYGVFRNTVGTELRFRSIRPGTGLAMTETPSGDEITIDTLLKQAFNTVSVGAVNITTNAVNNTLALTEGAGISLTGNNTDKSVTVAVNLSAVNSASQSGSNILNSYSAGSFVFNKLQAGTGVTLTTGVNGEIVLSAPQVGTVTGGENLGESYLTDPLNGGVALFEDSLSTDSTLKFRRIRPGLGISVTMTGDQEYMEISTTAAAPGGAGAGIVSVGQQYQLAYYPNAVASSTVGPTPLGIGIDLTDPGSPVIAADIDGTVSDISNHTTDSLTEGTANLYWTEARFDNSLSTKSTSNLAEGTNQYFTADRAQDAVSDMMLLGNPTPFTVTGVAQAASTSTATVTVSNTSGITSGMTVTGPGIAVGTTVGTVLTSTTFTVTPAIFAPTGTAITLTGATTLILNVTANTVSTAQVAVTNFGIVLAGQYVSGPGITGRVQVQTVTGSQVVLTPGYNVNVALGATLTFRDVTGTGVMALYDDSNDTFTYTLDQNYLSDQIRSVLSVVPNQGLSYDPVQGRFGLSGAVTSVNGFSGAVQLAVGDITGAAPIANPTFTGVPRVPDLTVSSPVLQIANKNYVDTIRTSITGNPLAGLTTLQALGNAINGDTLFFQTVNSNLNTKLNITGGTMNGLLNLNYTIDFATTNGQVAANKTYVDQRSTVQTVNSKQGNVVLNTDDITERVSPAAVNVYFTNTRARSAISLTTNDSSILSYAPSTGTFSFSRPDTDKIQEGITNLYWTVQRTRDSVNLVVNSGNDFASYNSSTGVFTINATTDNLSQGSTNRFYTDTLARSAFTLSTNASQNALLTYNSSTGQFTVNSSTANLIEGGGNLFYTDTRVRDALSVTVTQLNAISAVNTLTFNRTTGVFTFNANTDNITEGATNKYFSNTGVRAAIDLTSNDTSIFTYDRPTGVFTFVRPNTDKILEGITNQYFTAQRARDSVSAVVTQTNGLAVSSSFTYNSTTGAFTFNSNTDNIAEGLTNKYASLGRVAGLLSLNVTTSDGATPGAFLSYSDTTGVTTFNNSTDSLREGSVNKWASDATVRGKLTTNTAQNALTYNSTTGQFTFAPTVSASLVYTPTPGPGEFHFSTAQNLTTTGTPKFKYVSREVRTGVPINSGEVTIDLSQGTVHVVTRNANIVNLAFTNVPTTGSAVEVTVIFNNTSGNGSFAVSSSSVRFQNGAEPTLTSTVGRQDIIKFLTVDGGTTWYETSRSLNLA